MKLEDIDWDKKLIVFFGDDAKNIVDDIAKMRKGAIVIFPEHKLYHPWEHVVEIEHIARILSNGDDRKFVVVTNSSYILDHLSNLMKGARINADAKYTRCNRKEAYIHKKDVGAYVCTKGTIENALPKEGDIIDWDNLSVVAEWLTDTYFDMGD
jgi:predicted ATPase